MKIPQLTGCCGYLSLKTDVICIGVLSLAGTLLLLLEASDDLYGAYQGIPLPGILVQLVAVLAYWTVIDVLTSILLIAGAVRDRPEFLIPWLVLGSIRKLEVLIVEIVECAVKSDNQQGNALNLPAAVSFAFVLAAFLLSVYMWLVVFSLYRQLSTDELRVNRNREQSASSDKIFNQM